MNSFTLALLAFGAIALMVYGVSQILLSRFDGDKKTLRRRLDTPGGKPQGDEFDPAKFRVVQDLDGDFTGWTRHLKNFGPARGLALLLNQANPDKSLQSLLQTMLGLFAVGFIVPFMVRGSVFVGLVAGLILALVPIMLLTRKKAKRQQMMDDQLPNALDFLGRAMRAGHSLTTGWAMLGSELPDPLAAEFRRCHDRHAMGVDLDTCLREMTKRIESVDFAFFITAVLIQRQTGGDLAGVLDNIGDMIRQRIRLQKTLKSKTAEGRFTGYVLTAFPAVMFVILYMMNPEYAGILLTEPLGKGMLVTAVIMQIMGLFMIQKLTKLKV
jgi:tight adherence protein B